MNYSQPKLWSHHVKFNIAKLSTISSDADLRSFSTDECPHVRIEITNNFGIITKL